jgi:predicted TIM-barrel fold metal-dependent hydrolase
MQTPVPSIRVDSHFHVFEAGCAVAGARYVPRYAATLARWRECAASVGVHRGVLVQPSFLGCDNRQLLAALAAHPHTLVGVAVVEPSTERHMLQDLHAAGVRGVRLNLAGCSHDVAQWSRNHAFWDCLLAMGWHVQVHTDAGRLPDVLPRLPPDLHVVVDHMAKPHAPRPSDPTLRFLGRLGPDRVSVKLSAAYRLGGVNPRDVAQALLAELGPSALLWGSDWPCTNFESWADYAALFANLAYWLDLEATDAALCANPMRLYWGGARAA